MAWSDEAFRARVAARAEELGLSIGELLETAHVSRESFYKLPQHGRRIDTIDKIAQACGWNLAQAMGFPSRMTRKRNVLLVYVETLEVIRALPTWARTDQRWAEAFTILYNELVRQQENGPIEETELAARLSTCGEYLRRSLQVVREDTAFDPEFASPKR